MVMALMLPMAVVAQSPKGADIEFSSNIVDLGEYFNRDGKTALLTARQVGLREVSGDYRL